MQIPRKGTEGNVIEKKKAIPPLEENKNNGVACSPTEKLLHKIVDSSFFVRVRLSKYGYGRDVYAGGRVREGLRRRSRTRQSPRPSLQSAALGQTTGGMPPRPMQLSG